MLWVKVQQRRPQLILEGALRAVKHRLERRRAPAEQQQEPPS